MGASPTKHGRIHANRYSKNFAAGFASLNLSSGEELPRGPQRPSGLGHLRRPCRYAGDAGALGSGSRFLPAGIVHGLRRTLWPFWVPGRTRSAQKWNFAYGQLLTPSSMRPGRMIRERDITLSLFWTSSLRRAPFAYWLRSSRSRSSKRMSKRNTSRRWSSNTTAAGPEF